MNLQYVLVGVKTWSGMMPICAWCKKIKNDEGYWQKRETDIRHCTKLGFTHCICNDCAKKEYPELYRDLDIRETDG